jgi:glycosyltransferase involved in cell wall biosynthesis
VTEASSEREVRTGRLGATDVAASRGVRVVLDARPLQTADRSPVTARYLDGLLGAFDADPLEGESFAFLLQSDLEDPTTRFERLSVVGRRLMPPTRLLRSGALTVDPFLLRGASVGVAWRAERSGAAGAVFHAVGGGGPLFARIPTLVTLIDLAPWEMAATFQRGVAARFGQRLRRQLVRDAAAVIVVSPAVARDTRRLLRVSADRIRVVPLAPHPAFRPLRDGDPAALMAERERLGLAERYLVYFGRYDARHDVRTLLEALSILGAQPRPRGLGKAIPWPPQLLLAGATPDDRAAVARAAARFGVGQTLVYVPNLAPERLALLVAGARAALQPAVSDAAGLAAMDALAAGVPVVASAVGALPDVVGGAGILVASRDRERLATAVKAIWADDRVHRDLAAVAMARASGEQRTWADVARETRRIYEEVATGAARG